MKNEQLLTNKRKIMKKKTKKILFISVGVLAALVGVGIYVKRRYDSLQDIKDVGDARDLDNCANLQDISIEEAKQPVKLKAGVVYEISTEDVVSVYDKNGRKYNSSDWMHFVPVEEAVRGEYNGNQPAKNVVTVGPKKRILKGSKPWVFEDSVTNGKVILKKGEKMNDFCLKKELNPISALRSGTKTIIATIPLEGE